MTKIFLAMPGYGKQTAEAGRGFWCASADRESVIHGYSPGSLLAANFNTLWCAALNLVHQGCQVDYFAMLHDDIGPEDWWLDKLIAELEAKQLDILGVAVPIKDPRGLTSLAIDSGTVWTQRRLTMTEVHNLPETFTSADVGGPLLLNTGCWVCKFDPAWVYKVHFTINDRIIFNSGANRYEPEVEPEDWYFSRLLHEIGLKIGATRKIRLIHRGDTAFDNSHPWGWEKTDTEQKKIQHPLPAEQAAELLEV